VFLWHSIPVVYASFFFLTGILKLGGAVSLGSFFDDIHIPEHLLQQPSTFDEDEKLWVWNYNGTPMYMDLDEDVRFRVVQVKYPPIPIEQEKNAKPFAPMQITVRAFTQSSTASS
jgi:DNA-directed RNA polymerase III subunit RPC8